MNVKYVKSGQDAHVYIVESYRVVGDPNPKSRTVKKLGLLSSIKREHGDVDAYLKKVLSELKSTSDERKTSILDSLDGKYADLESYAEEYHIGHMLLKAIWDELNLAYFFKYHGSRLIGSGSDTERAVFALFSDAFASLGTQRDPWDTHKSFVDNDLAEIGSVSVLLEFFDDIKDKLANFLQKKDTYAEKKGITYLLPSAFDCVSTQSTGVKQREMHILAFVRVCGDTSFSSVELSSGAGISPEELEKINARGDILVSNRFATSNNDLVSIRKSGLGYVIRGRIKNMPKSVQSDILSSDGYTSVNPDFRYKQQIRTENVRDGVSDVILEEKLVYTYSQKRFKKERGERISLPTRFFHVTDGESFVQTSAEDSDSDRAFDGYRCIRSSGYRLTASEIIDASKMATRIDDHLKSIRGMLEARRGVVWSSKRVRGFYTFAFLVMHLLGVAETRLEISTGSKIAYDRIVAAIVGARIVPMDKKGRVWKTVGISEDFKQISDAFGKPRLLDVSTASELKKIIGFTVKL